MKKKAKVERLVMSKQERAFVFEEVCDRCAEGWPRGMHGLECPMRNTTAESRAWLRQMIRDLRSARPAPKARRKGGTR